MLSDRVGGRIGGATGRGLPAQRSDRGPAPADAPPAVVHAVFAGGSLVLWGEGPQSAALAQAAEAPAAPAVAADTTGAMPAADAADTAVEDAPAHPAALNWAELGTLAQRAAGGSVGEPARVPLRLPALPRGPLMSATLRRLLGQDEWQPGDEAARLGVYSVPALRIDAWRAPDVLESLLELARHAEDGAAWGGRAVSMGPGVEFYALVTRLARHLLAQQRFVPMLRQSASGELSGAWYPWVADEATAQRVRLLVGAMPAAARCAVDDRQHDAWRVTEGALSAVVDALCRRTLVDESMLDTVTGRDPADAQVAWMQALLGDADDVRTPAVERGEVARRVRRWIGTLDERGQSSAWRLLLRLNEPPPDKLPATMDAPADNLEWSVSFHLQSQDDSSLIVDGADIWLLTRESLNVGGLHLEKPQELLLAELGRASRIYKKLESALDDSEPVDVPLKTKDAYAFLREVKPVLMEQGFGVECPAWWESPAGRLGARLRIESDPLEALVDSGAGAASGSGPQLGLSALVGYHWEIAIGDTTLTLNEFEQLAAKKTPLVRINGRWVEIRPEDVASAIEFIKENPGGSMKLGEALRLAFSADLRQTGVPILGLDASGWVSQMLGAGGDGADGGSQRIPMLETPGSFKGTLRPYQQRGLSWLAFMERFGFGACLADDMGLGKTVQLLALLLNEREARLAAAAAGEVPKSDRPADKRLMGPTLLIVPMSVVGNWTNELKRFAPDIRVLVHHGLTRLAGDDLLVGAVTHDIVITTYALANRDRETLEQVGWNRIVLDEAQCIKNPAAKQSLAVRSLPADKRIALTGTPVENRLSELWSIMDFLNPGYLGPSATFRKKFSMPIERYRDAGKAEQLRGLVRPFILRRVKTDPTVVADLPDKLETREYTHLTSEQAALYESTVKRMLSEVEASEGIHRRGLVLAALIRLKQICNHPSQMLKDHEPESATPPDHRRSGKCTRLLEMMDEVLAEGEKALVFTQFRQMGHLLASMLRHEMGRDVLFLHGGTPQGARTKMVEMFQDGKSNKPILILSLKAGGVGLNLTAATHVFHFDRWWNPAVENQATDRAYRIGQTRTVHVHKFVVRGTLEERIDEMIESKTELAEKIIGAGERWLTELSSDQLRDILTLRADAIGDDE